MCQAADEDDFVNSERVGEGLKAGLWNVVEDLGFFHHNLSADSRLI
jgi:hypothetical protein